jgi:hypothetical protein
MQRIACRIVVSSVPDGSKAMPILPVQLSGRLTDPNREASCNSSAPTCDSAVKQMQDLISADSADQAGAFAGTLPARA